MRTDRKMFLPGIALVCLAIASVALVGCGREANSTAPVRPSLEDQLRSDPDVLTLVAIRDDLTQRALRSGLTGEDLRDVIESGSEEAFADALGYTRAEWASLSDRFELARQRFADRYAGVLGVAGHSPECDLGEFSRAFERARQHLPDIQARNPKPVTCNWLPYLSSLALCTEFGPVLYWPCAFLAMCQYCTGGYVDSLCGR